MSSCPPEVIERCTILAWLQEQIHGIDPAKLNVPGMTFAEAVEITLQFCFDQIAEGEHHRAIKIHTILSDEPPAKRQGESLQ